jgi:competence protein ComEC
MDPVWQANGKEVQLTGRIGAPIQRLMPTGCRSLLVLDLPYSGRSDLILPDCGLWQEGWRVRVQGRLQKPNLAVHPLLGDGGQRLAQQGIFSRLIGRRVQVLDTQQGLVLQLRQHLNNKFQHAAGPQAGSVLAALLMGSAVVDLPDNLKQQFRAAGLSHALAASGFHLTVLLGLVLALLRRSKPALRLAAGLGAMLVFLVLAGPQPSVLRALLMGAAALFIQINEERSKPFGLLIVSLFLLLMWQPAWLLDVGFQLSATATAGLILTAPRLEKRCHPLLAVPLAAWLWTLPLQLLHFGVVPIYAVPANLLASPLISVLTIGSIASALLAIVLPPLLAPCIWLLQLPLNALLLLVEYAAKLPLALIFTGKVAAGLVCIFSIGLLPWLLPLKRWRLLGILMMLFTSVYQIFGLLQNQLILIHQASGSLLLARNQGRAALISTDASIFSCQRAKRLQYGLGIARLDWLVLLDPMVNDAKFCWQQLAGLVQVLPQGVVRSEGLSFKSFPESPGAGLIEFGDKRWAIFPQPVSASSFILPKLDGIWLGRSPHEKELIPASAATIWISGSNYQKDNSPTHWQFTGERGWLIW